MCVCLTAYGIRGEEHFRIAQDLLEEETGELEEYPSMG